MVGASSASPQHAADNHNHFVAAFLIRAIGVMRGFSCRIRITHHQKLVLTARISGGESVQVEFTKLECGAHDLLSSGSDSVIEGLGNFTNQTMGAQQTKQTSDLSSSLLTRFGVGPRIVQKALANVFITEPLQQE